MMSLDRKEVKQMADIHINVDDKLKKDIKIACVHNGETLTEYILRLIENDIKEQQKEN